MFRQQSIHRKCMQRACFRKQCDACKNLLSNKRFDQKNRRGLGSFFCLIFVLVGFRRFYFPVPFFSPHFLEGDLSTILLFGGIKKPRAQRKARDKEPICVPSFEL